MTGVQTCALPISDAEHPYGHQRFETAASLALGVILLAVGVGNLWSAAVKLENPEAIAQVHVQTSAQLNLSTAEESEGGKQLGA